MTRRFIFVLSIVTISLASNAQFDTVFAKTRIKICADSLTNAFKTRNWEQYVMYLNPALIGSMNGRDSLMRYLDASTSSIPSSAWKQYSSGKILQVLKTAGDLQAVIGLKTILEYEGKRYTTLSHLVGESWDGGYFWRFFDSDGDAEMARLIKPDLSLELYIPRKTESVEEIK